MLSENESESTRIENDPIFLLGVIIIVVILISICALSVLLSNELMKSRLRTQQVMPVLDMPTASASASNASHPFIGAFTDYSVRICSRCRSCSRTRSDLDRDEN